MSKATPFEQVWSAELESIRGADQQQRSAKNRAHAEGMFGISLSGGGIRSATFNLGMLQAIAGRKLLGKADYLSINSGGGYIGSWLLAWIKRRGIARVEQELARAPAQGIGPDGPADDCPEPKPISFLRGFSNYLTPKVGLFSADTWMVIATYLRNLLLNLAILIAALAAVLLIPRGVLEFSKTLSSNLSPMVLLGAAAALLAFGATTTGLNTYRLWSRNQPSYATQGWIQKTVVLPLFASAWLGALAIRLSDDTNWGWWHELSGEFHLPGWWPDHPGWTWILVPAVLYLIPWLLVGSMAYLLGLGGSKTERSPRAPQRGRMWRAILLAAPPAGAVGGLMLWAANGLSALVWPYFSFDQTLIHITVWGAPLLVGILVLTAVFHVGLIGRGFSEHERQWWSRLGAWMLIYGLAWLGLFGTVFYGPIVVIWLGTILAAMLSLGWLMTTIGGVLAGKRQQTGGSSQGAASKLLSGAAPTVFVIGLLLLLSTGIHAALDKAAGAENLQFESSGRAAELCRDFWPGAREKVEGAKGPFAADLMVIADCHSARVWVATRGYVLPYILLLLLAAIGLSSRVDINAFSMHLFYRSRLIRAYLGASNAQRRANLFTGFDPEDDVDLTDLSGPDYDGPYPILNTALNLVAGDELAWQERKASSFVFTPMYAGFRTRGDVDPARPPDGGLDRYGFRETARYDNNRGISLGTAMAISGAAISPSMGAQSTAAMAFLLTVFNVRLGWWLGNPRAPKTANRLGPRVGLRQLLDELFGLTNEQADYVYLSDGGHFENLALYELVRRRCRFILVSDAGADPKMIFGDLGNAIRKCRTDFGIDIDFDLEPLRRRGDSRFSTHHCAIGSIRYDLADPGAQPGVLLYVKASLNGQEPEDILNYAASSPDFPHEATVDQWFSESQFESYRALGRHIGDQVFAVADGDEDVMDIFEKFKASWTAP